MGRRIRWLGVILVLAFALVIAQLVNIQKVKAPSLQASAFNPRNQAESFDNNRGNIYASDGTLLADSVKSEAASPHEYLRQYPQGSLYSQVVGYSSPYYGTAGIENEYDDQLVEHTMPAQTLSQALGFNPLETSTDNLTLTINPTLQKAAAAALSQVSGANKDAGVVAMDPSTGAILADYSNPTFDPNALANPNIAAERRGWLRLLRPKGRRGHLPGSSLGNWRRLSPRIDVQGGDLDGGVQPRSRAYQFRLSPRRRHQVAQFERSSDQRWEGQVCGGTMVTMLPESCDPGYGLLGIALGAPILSKQAELFGYNTTPPIDLPKDWVTTPAFPAVSAVSPPNQAFLAYSAIGQFNVKASALSNVLVAAGIANHGVVMRPYLVQQVSDNAGATVSTTKPAAFMTAATPQAAASVTSLMESVVTSGTADGVGFSPSLNAAVKTGTAQTGNPQANTDDWMIGFAPASDPKVAVAVVVPLQPFGGTGAGIAGPIMKAMLNAAAGLQGGK